MAIPKTPKLRRQASGKTKPKAPGKANPVTPAQRTYGWGNKSAKPSTVSPTVGGGKGR